MPEFLVGPLPMLFERDFQALSLFTTISTLGTPEDISLDEFRVEIYFSWTPLQKSSSRPRRSHIRVARSYAPASRR